MTLDAAGMILSHLEQVARVYSGALFSYQLCHEAVEGLRRTSPALVDAGLGTLCLSDIHKVLRVLLSQGVSIREIDKIFEVVVQAETKQLDFVLTRVVQALSKEEK